MSRARFDQAACDTLAGCVQEIERLTAAELIIIVRARSGIYRHADMLFGAILSFWGLVFLIYSPITFAPYWVIIDFVLFFALGWLISSRSSTLRRFLTTTRFRRQAVRTAAAAMFYEAGIANTEAELGVLIYLSLLERRLELIADRGLLRAVPPQEWNEQLFALHSVGKQPDVETFLMTLREFGKLLATHVPALEENPNELPDRPRFELK